MKIALALLSFAFFRVTRGVLRAVQSLYFRAAKAEAARWRTLSAEALRRPLAMPIVMTTGPRWNPHAIIASAGPFRAHGRIEIDAAAAASSAGAWTVVVHEFPSYRTVAFRGSSAVGQGPISLPPGRYALALRYYRWSGQPVLPQVTVDGRAQIAARAIDAATNGFYATLAFRKSWFYTCLHYYILVMLEWRGRLPESFVKGEFLPVGNPETEFRFGLLGPGKAPPIDGLNGMPNSGDVYVTVYDRASFPVDWYPLPPGRETLPANGGAYYLIRGQRRAAEAGDP